MPEIPEELLMFQKPQPHSLSIKSEPLQVELAIMKFHRGLQPADKRKNHSPRLGFLFLTAPKNQLGKL